MFSKKGIFLPWSFHFLEPVFLSIKGRDWIKRSADIHTLSVFRNELFPDRCLCQSLYIVSELQICSFVLHSDTVGLPGLPCHLSFSFCESKVSQWQHYWHFGLYNCVWMRAILCSGRMLSRIPGLYHQMPTTFSTHVVKTKKSPGIASVPWRAKSP